jgi:hypothetical protein
MQIRVTEGRDLLQEAWENLLARVWNGSETSYNCKGDTAVLETV